jgi:hypothetical protein
MYTFVDNLQILMIVFSITLLNFFTKVLFKEWNESLYLCLDNYMVYNYYHYFMPKESQPLYHLLTNVIYLYWLVPSSLVVLPSFMGHYCSAFGTLESLLYGEVGLNFSNITLYYSIYMICYNITY